MDWQLLTSVILVAAASAYLIRQAIRSWSMRKSGCGGGCGCSAKASTPSQPQLISDQELLSRIKQKS